MLKKSNHLFNRTIMTVNLLGTLHVEYHREREKYNDLASNMLSGTQGLSLDVSPQKLSSKISLRIGLAQGARTSRVSDNLPMSN